MLDWPSPVGFCAFREKRRRHGHERSSSSGGHCAIAKFCPTPLRGCMDGFLD